MDLLNSDQFAFPAQGFSGCSKREYFAVACLAGLCHKNDFELKAFLQGAIGEKKAELEMFIDTRACVAVKYADALIRALKGKVVLDEETPTTVEDSTP
jgi:hypothetical protein